MRRMFEIVGILTLLGAVILAEESAPATVPEEQTEAESAPAAGPEEPVEQSPSAVVPEQQSSPAKIHLVPEEFLNRGKDYSLQCASAADKVEFFSAFRMCLDLGLEFASVESRSDSAALDIALAGYGDDVWLSGSDLGKPGSWIWLANNHKVGRWNNYANWKHGEPDGRNHCMSASLQGEKSKWSASKCDKKLCYVCQKYLT
ncbi:galactose-specific lectin nattectin-like [Toxorhynchites rutilus septentrionalis]|uniref:galactose-specific lectin nattectin-like n=1 Tax=Toxorhynchites rutilus septentrionalis TaxID=329112 RepID=UPI00247AB82E|nr:galactose-specific lectin nattectin-like [Toxorhynchites rutilus septentrionalis]